jgi:hypothetical protein
MTKDEFKALFDRALELAAENAEKKLGRPIPRKFEIEMHAFAPHPRMLQKNDALETIYLGPDLFYRIIDVAVTRVGKDKSIVFMRISGHEPGPMNKTWNQPIGSGPFKQLLPDEVKLK